MCTGIKIVAENGSKVYGRTLEFATNINSKILFVPRNYDFVGTTSQGKYGLRWKSKYAVVGMNASNVNVFVDGVNEAGLAGGLFYFPDYAEYQSIEQKDISNSIAPWELLAWILTNFSTIGEVKTNILKIKVTNTILPEWGIIPPVHVILHDLSGQSLVIEYINGKLELKDNPLGVLTNSPSFDWHITNLRNYINLSALNVAKIELKNINLKPLSQGSGMLGLPGDFTSPSRFVRAAAFTQSIVNVKNEDDAVLALFHILNLFDIPYGSIRESNNSDIEYEYTQWTSGVDLQNKIYYFHTYNNRNLRKIDLMKMNLNQKDVRVTDIIKEEKIFDIL